MAQGRASWPLWAQLALRAISVVLLLVCLGYLAYCSAKFGAHLGAGYILDPILLVLNLGILIRVCILIFGSGTPTLGRGELVCMCLADIIAIFLAIFCGGILPLGYSAAPPECTNLCEALVTLLAGAYQVTVACLFFAVLGLAFFSAVLDLIQCCMTKERQDSQHIE